MPSLQCWLYCSVLKEEQRGSCRLGHREVMVFVTVFVFVSVYVFVFVFVFVFEFIFVFVGIFFRVPSYQTSRLIL